MEQNDRICLLTEKFLKEDRAEDATAFFRQFFIVFNG